MFCQNCGAQIADGSNACPYCGAQLTPAQPTYQQPSAQQGYQQQGYQQQGYQQTPYQAQGYQQPYQQPVQQQPPLKWHKFLVYFGLWAGAVINLISGISTMLGSQYGESADLVYRAIPGLRIIDIIYGLALLGIAATGVLTALKLLKFKKDAPKMLLYLLIASAVAGLLYSVVGAAILSARGGDVSSVISSAVGSVAGSAAMIALNRTYYKKREHLFVN